MDVGGKNTSPTGQQITMHDVPLMDAADVSPTMDGDCQPCSLGRDSRRDSGEENLAQGENYFHPEMLEL